MASPYDFRLVLKTGTYVVSAQFARTVTAQVTAGKTTQVDLFDGCV